MTEVGEGGYYNRENNPMCSKSYAMYCNAASTTRIILTSYLGITIPQISFNIYTHIKIMIYNVITTQL